MDIDTLITYLVLFFAFVLPSVLKRKGKGKKRAAKKTKKRTIKIFGRIGDAIREFLRELEKQALEARKKQQEGEPSAWDQLDDRAAEDWTTPDRDMEDPGDREPEPVHGPVPEARRDGADHSFASAREVRLPLPGDAAGTPASREAGAETVVRAALPAHSLQQAVIWSEILGKPKALKD